MSEFLKEQQALDEPLPAEPAGTPPPGTGSAIVAPRSVPVPYEPHGEGDLSAGEEADLATCEAAIDNLRLAFAVAGKALQVIRDARLYRSTHDTFEDYAEQRWDMSRAQAYRLIGAWPLAELLSPIGDNALTERQVRELLPLAGRHGQDAVATVYRAVTETDGIRVTAALLHDVAGIFPAGHFDHAEAVGQIRAYLSGDYTPPGTPPADPVQTFALQSGKLVKNLQRFAASETIKAARTADPDAVRQAFADIRATLDEIEGRLS